jgi:RNA polymerase sigma-70 factor (ECF subfamily)
MTDRKRNSERMNAYDTDLILNARQGNMDAFEELVQRYDKQVLTIAAGYVQSSDDAKDIYQEVFLRVYRNLSKFQMRSEFSTWLFRITTNVCLTHRSRSKRQSHISLDQPVTDDDGQTHSFKDTLPDPPEEKDAAERMEICGRVAKALEKLSARQRMIFTLRHYEGYKLKEIARMTACTEGTVKRYLFEATARVRKELADLA